MTVVMSMPKPSQDRGGNCVFDGSKTADISVPLATTVISAAANLVCVKSPGLVAVKLNPGRTLLALSAVAIVGTWMILMVDRLENSFEGLAEEPCSVEQSINNNAMPSE